jgi:hypothetical protein
VEKLIKRVVCDFCSNDNDEPTNKCEICGQDFCYSCTPDEDWTFRDTCVCIKCNDKLNKEFDRLKLKLKKESE